LKLPLVDLNDTDPFPGIPKIRPDNIAIGHLGAEHLLERGFRALGFYASRTRAGRANAARVFLRR
jgi:LacI family transcriptional regulator